MGNVLVREETLTAIADSIRMKHGSVNVYKPAEMPEAIASISTKNDEGKIADPSLPIRFYGAYGELLYSYTVEEFSEMTELPQLPQYPGLISQEWNWTMEKIKEINGEVEIGSIHITDDGSTRIYVELVEGALNPKVGFHQNMANAVLVDWGDGSDYESSESEIVSIEHLYTEAGKYVIRLIPKEDAEFYFISDSSGGVLLHEDLNDDLLNRGYMGTIRKIELGTNISFLGDHSLSGGTLEYVIMPSSITNFGTAFYGCKGIKYLVFPRGVASFASYAARECLSLKKIVFPETEVGILSYAFQYCSSLEEIVMPVGGKYLYQNAFAECTALKRAVMSKTVTQINAYAFDNNKSLNEIVLESDILSIGDRVFRNCNSLKKIEIPNKVRTLGSYAFSGCYMLQKIAIPENIKEIEASCFASCYSLTKMTIPGNVSTINSNAFAYCYCVNDYYILPMTPPTLANVNAFSGIRNTCKMHVPKGCLEAYQTAENWSTYADYMVEMEE